MTSASPLIIDLSYQREGWLLFVISTSAMRRLSHICKKAGQLMEIIANSPLIWEGRPIDISCAVGLHQFVGEQSADDALSKADASMYKQKRRHYEKKNTAQ